MKKYELYRQERKKGLTYRQIADKYGVSYQNIALACGKAQPRGFRWFTESSCVYPNVRKWLNENKISVRELTHRLGWEWHKSNFDKVTEYIRGDCYPRKEIIDKLLSITGLTYEKFFEKEDEGK